MLLIPPVTSCIVCNVLIEIGVGRTELIPQLQQNKITPSQCVSSSPTVMISVLQTKLYHDTSQTIQLYVMVREAASRWNSHNAHLIFS